VRADPIVLPLPPADSPFEGDAVIAGFRPQAAACPAPAGRQAARPADRSRPVFETAVDAGAVRLLDPASGEAR